MATAHPLAPSDPRRMIVTVHIFDTVTQRLANKCLHPSNMRFFPTAIEAPEHTGRRTGPTACPTDGRQCKRPVLSVRCATARELVEPDHATVRSDGCKDRECGNMQVAGSTCG
jgi:hypothetical protein